MKETIISIARWHEETFPDATLDGQIEKYKEELHEWEESHYEDISELADMFIVACGIARFDLSQGLIYMADLYDQFVGNDSIGIDGVMTRVEQKMEKNRKRVWAKTAEGTYHHTNKE